MRRAGPHPFEAGVGETLRRRRLAKPGEPLLVALSGGPDSTALLAALRALSLAGAVGPITACHVDHGLRPGSERDAEHCARLCRELGVPLDRRAVHVAPGNVQARARQARYAALREAAAGAGAVRIATGHTRSDQAETLLLRLLRGAGARGLAGIPPRRRGPGPAVVRPLIDRSRAEVIAYLRDRGLGWLEDPSNASGRYLRNRVRLEILPAIVALAPGAEAALARAADLLRGDDRVLDTAARGLVAGAGAPLGPFRAAPVALRRRAVRALWREATGSRRGLAAGHVEAVLQLAARGRPAGARVALPGGREARVEGGELVVGPPRVPAPVQAPVVAGGPGRYPVPGREVALVVEPGGAGPRPGAGGLALGEGRAAWPLTLRTRLPGDRFRPARGRGQKKLKAWLIDRKVPRAARDRLLLLVDASGRVLWIPELGAAAEGLDPAGEPGWSVRLEPGTGRNT